MCFLLTGVVASDCDGLINACMSCLTLCLPGCFSFYPFLHLFFSPFSLQMAAVVFSLMLHKCISAAGCVYDETVAFTSSCLLSGSLSGSVCFCSVLGRRCISLILLSSRLSLALFRSVAVPTGLLKPTDTLMRSEPSVCVLFEIACPVTIKARCLGSDASPLSFRWILHRNPSFNWIQCSFNRDTSCLSQHGSEIKDAECWFS